MDAAKSKEFHKACREGNYDVVKTLLEEGVSPDVKRLGLAPIYVATNGGYAKIVQLLLDKGGDPNIVDKRQRGSTAMHLAAASGNKKIVEILLNKKSDCTIMDDAKRTPMMNACINGHTEVVKMLLKLGNDKSPLTYQYRDGDKKAQPFKTTTTSVVSSINTQLETVDGPIKSRSVMVEAINRGREDMAVVIIDHALTLTAIFQYKYFDHITEKEVTPLRQLIKKMPAVAELAFNRVCSHVPKPHTISRDDPEFKITLYYQYLEDFEDPPQRPRRPTSSGRERAQDESMKLIGNNEIIGQPKPTWKLKNFSRANHCLHILAKSDSKKLLKHPLVTTLLYYKWISFAQYLFLFNLFLHILFTSLLTSFTLLLLQPESTTCMAVRRSNNSTDGVCTIDHGAGHHSAIWVLGVMIIIVAIVRLVYELYRFFKHKPVYHYLYDWVNFIQVPLFLFSILFAFVFTTKCLCPANWQWQIGAVCVFLAWIDLIAFVRMVPIIGIYVVMLMAIVKNFIQVAALAVFLVLSFSFSFYMLFHDPENEQLNIRTPFQNAGKSFMKTMTMTTGGFDYDTLFRQDYTPGPGLQYAEVTYPLSIVFVVMMPILLMNLLTGLAVYDVKEIKENAEIKSLALSVEFILLFEELLPDRWRLKLKSNIKEKEIFSPDTFPNELTKKIWFRALNLSHYDTYDTRLIAPDASKENKKLVKRIDEMDKKIEQLQQTNAQILEMVKKLIPPED